MTRFRSLRSYEGKWNGCLTYTRYRNDRVRVSNVLSPRSPALIFMSCFFILLGSGSWSELGFGLAIRVRAGTGLKLSLENWGEFSGTRRNSSLYTRPTFA